MSHVRDAAAIDWERWEPALRITHIDPSCDKCLFPGPLLTRFGLTIQPAFTTRRITRPSRIAEGQRLQSVSEHHPPAKVRTHFAVRCPNCGEHVAYALASSDPGGAMVEIESLYEPPRFDRVRGSVAAACMTPLFDTTETEPLTRKERL